MGLDAVTLVRSFTATASGAGTQPDCTATSPGGQGRPRRRAPGFHSRGLWCPPLPPRLAPVWRPQPPRPPQRIGRLSPPGQPQFRQRRCSLASGMAARRGKTRHLPGLPGQATARPRRGTPITAKTMTSKRNLSLVRAVDRRPNLCRWPGEMPERSLLWAVSR